MRAHFQNEDWQGQSSGHGQVDFQAAQLHGASVLFHFAGPVGDDFLRRVTRPSDRLPQGGGRSGIAGDADGGALGRQVDARFRNTGNSLQGLFNTAYTGGACHTLNIKLYGFFFDAIAGIPHRRDHGRHVR